MKTFHHIAELQKIITELKQQQKTISFVPTMGNLHEGHLQLVKQAKAKADVVIVSIFVNPMQFGANEDFDRYPRTFEQDQQKLELQKVNFLFAPNIDDMYPEGTSNTTYVDIPAIGDDLCGAYRPGHFRGICTVVLKLMNLVQPDFMFLGEKDYQQVFIIKKMTKDLFLSTKIRTVETVREYNGLAMSSRNQYLSTEQKSMAAELFQSLCDAAEKINQGELDFDLISQQAMDTLRTFGFEPQYFEIRKQSDLSKAQQFDQPLIILVAAYLGQTRLIDNLKVGS